MSKDAAGNATSSIGMQRYVIFSKPFSLRARSSMFAEISTPTADTAPFSTAYAQCQPNPQPRSKNRFPAKQGSIFLSACHSPAPASPFIERSIWLYLSKKILSSYLFSFIANVLPIVIQLLLYVPEQKKAILYFSSGGSNSFFVLALKKNRFTGSAINTPIIVSVIRSKT